MVFGEFDVRTGAEGILGAFPHPFTRRFALMENDGSRFGTGLSRGRDGKMVHDLVVVDRNAGKKDNMRLGCRRR